MNLDEIRRRVEEFGMDVIESVDPATAAESQGYIVVSGHAIMPLDGVAWSVDRAEDLPILNPAGTEIGTLCLLRDRPALPVIEMTAWQYAAFLVDCGFAGAGSATHRFTRDYAVVDETELANYVEHYLAGSAIWGGFHHGTSDQTSYGWRTSIVARPDIVAPTPYHSAGMLLATRATGAREQYLKLYHLIELLFDYVTYRRVIKAGDDLIGFGKVIHGFQRGELDRLKAILRDFCGNVDAIATRLLAVAPFVVPAGQMLQLHGKDGNPLKDENWVRYLSIIAGGTFTMEAAKILKLASSVEQYEKLVMDVAAYQIYRMRSSIAHSRVGEYVLTEDDDPMIARFGVPLIEEVAAQILGGEQFSQLMA
jgi:hypothetical protein